MYWSMSDFRPENIWLCVLIHTHTCTCTCTYIQHMYTHTHIHTHTDNDSPAQPSDSDRAKGTLDGFDDNDEVEYDHPRSGSSFGAWHCLSIILHVFLVLGVVVVVGYLCMHNRDKVSTCMTLCKLSNYEPYYTCRSTCACCMTTPYLLLVWYSCYNIILFCASSPPSSAWDKIWVD
jgi:hypothetical protein